MIEVLKFGSSVLRSSDDLRVAVDEVYRRWRTGYRVLAVVSAFEGVTDRLLSEIERTIGPDNPEATAAYVATGEQQTAALLVGILQRHGLPARAIEPREITLVAEGSFLESTPVRVNLHVLEGLWSSNPILVLPGFYGIDADGRTVLFGRGGSDLSALFLTGVLGAECRLLKDVPGVFEADPAMHHQAKRFSALSWTTAAKLSGQLIQAKALEYARGRTLSFEVGRPNEAIGTKIGALPDALEIKSDRPKPLSVALLGCGVVGRGVYDALKRYPEIFELRHVVVRDLERYYDIPEATTQASVALSDGADVVVICFGGTTLAYSIMAAALEQGKFVVTANKAAVALHGESLSRYVRSAHRRLWYSAAVGGALPAVETVERLRAPVREIRGIVNSTCEVILEAQAQGKSRAEAIAVAQSQGLTEGNPEIDTSGRDSADKLSILVDAAFHEWIDPEAISIRGVDAITGDVRGYKLIARAHREGGRIVATVAPEVPEARSFLGQAQGAENRLEIELTSGEIIRLRGRGAGRWPTAVSVVGDLLEIARLERPLLRGRRASALV
jgi:homoserine dehydrogenase